MRREQNNLASDDDLESRLWRVLARAQGLADADVPAVAQAMGRPVPVVEAALFRLGTRGLVYRAGGRYIAARTGDGAREHAALDTPPEHEATE